MSLLERVKILTSPLRVISILARAFGLVGLILAAIGIYGLIAYMVNQRTYEIGVRIALGANRNDIYNIILRQSLKISLIGSCAGLILSLSLTWSLSSILFGISSNDPATYLTIIILLILVALAASFFPARRAANINPISSLRNE